MALPPPLNFPTLEVAEAEAVGVELNRLQNVVVTLDKVGGWGWGGVGCYLVCGGDA